MAFNAEGTHPNAELVDEVVVGVCGAVDRWVMAAPLGVVFAFHNVHGKRALVSWDAVRAVEVEEEVADAQGAQFCHAQAADRGEAGS